MTNDQFSISNEFPITNVQLGIDKLDIHWDLVIGELEI